MSRVRLNLRLRLTVWYAAALCIVLALYAILVFTFLERSLFQQLDQRLHDDVEDMEAFFRASAASSPTSSGSVSAAEVLERLRTEDPDDDDLMWVEVWTFNGQRLYQSPRAAHFALPALSPPQAPGLRSVRLADNRHIRVNDESSLLGNEVVIIRATKSEDDLRAALTMLMGIMGLGIPISLGVAAFGGYRLARRALGPVDRMADRARTITAERLGERLSIENPDDELGRLARTFNDMFARLETSFDQMKRFSADASHELRTPLTAIRTVGEVALREARDPNEYREAIGSMLEEADRVTRLADALLMLSRADAGQIRITREDVDLVDLARQVAMQLEVLAEEKQQSLSVCATELVRAHVDPLVLRLAVVNLVDNAIHHSPTGARITVRIWASPTDAMIDVEDNGPGIAAIHHDRLFDRFYRVDEARTRQTDGAGAGVGVGLGLAITRWAVEVQDGRVEVISEVGHGSLFRIRLPREQAQSDSHAA
jgi:heavy metal sensor kinase